VDRKFTFSAGEYYHVYTRGVEKRTVFEDAYDYERFQKLLFFCNTKEPVVFRLIQGLPLYEKEEEERLIDVVGYSFMPNHFHLVIYEKEDGGISKFMGKLMTAYSMYFNKKYERSGPLFVRPFRAKHINDEPYFRWIFSYVHLNPVSLVEKGWEERGVRNKEKVEKFINNYRLSSFYDYSVSERPERFILNQSQAPDFLEEQNDLEDLLECVKGGVKES